jgi:hypothetical protein
MIEQFQESQMKQLLVREYDEEDWEFLFINFENSRAFENLNRDTLTNVISTMAV